MRRRRHRAGLALVGAATVLAGVLGAVGPASAATSTQPGLTAKSITVGQVDTLSGPVPGLFEGAENGTKAYLAYVNSTGAVNRPQILLDVQDDAFSGANTPPRPSSGELDLRPGRRLLTLRRLGRPGHQRGEDPRYHRVPLGGPQPRPVQRLPGPARSPGATRLGPFEYYKKEYPGAITHVGTLFSNVATADTSR